MGGGKRLSHEEEVRIGIAVPVITLLEPSSTANTTDIKVESIKVSILPKKKLSKKKAVRPKKVRKNGK